MTGTHATVTALCAAAAGIAAVHTLAPDHWMPTAALARAQGWSRLKLLGTTLWWGGAHVGSSIVLGGAGLWLGWQLDALQGLQGQRGTLALWLLVAFGLGYALWGVRRARDWQHAHAHGGAVHTHGPGGHVHHRHAAPKAAAHRNVLARKARPSGRVTVRPAHRLGAAAMLLVFVLGPCEAMLPLMFAGVALGPLGVVAVTLTFSAVTVATMVVLTFLAYAGFTRVRVQGLERYAHALTGAGIAACAGTVLVLGI